MADGHFKYAEVSGLVTNTLAAQFPNSAVETEEGLHGRVHVKIVSGVFNGKSEAEKQGMVWRVLDSELGPQAQAVSLVLPYGLDEF